MGMFSIPGIDRAGKDGEADKIDRWCSVGVGLMGISYLGTGDLEF